MDAFYVFKIIIGAKWRKASNLSLPSKQKAILIDSHLNDD